MDLAGKVTRLDVFQSVRVSWVLEYDRHNQPIGIGFLNSRPAFDQRSSQIEWRQVVYGRVGWVCQVGGLDTLSLKHHNHHATWIISTILDIIVTIVITTFNVVTIVSQ